MYLGQPLGRFDVLLLYPHRRSTSEINVGGSFKTYNAVKSWARRHTRLCERCYRQPAEQAGNHPVAPKSGRARQSKRAGTKR